MNISTTEPTLSPWARELGSSPLRPRKASPGVRNFHHALGQGVLRESVTGETYERETIGTDTRAKVNGFVVPFRWICSLKTKFQDPDSSKVVEFDSGTGVLIGPQCVLTAAHIVYADITGSRGTVKRQRALGTKVYPGRRDVNAFPFGGAESDRYFYLQKFEPNLDVRWDYALIKLKTAIGNKTFKSLNRNPLGWWGSTSAGAGTEIRALSRTYLQNLIVNVGGYPKDKSHVPQCAYDVINNSSPTVNGASVPELITYLVDTKDGQSGSPVWRYWKDSGKRCMVAVHHGSCLDVMDGCKTSTAGRPTSNTGVLITTDVLNQIEAWKRAM